MAPIELYRASSYVPTATLVLHLFLVGYFSVVAGHTIYRSYVALPPSSAIRGREPIRRGYVRTFCLLAVLSFASAGYFGVRFTSLSYRAWATEQGVELPDGIFGDKGALRGGEHPGRVHIVKWLSDTPLYRDSLEVVAEKARAFWWGQQINLGLTSWSMYLAIEGQRRKISNLWTFWALSQLVSLAYATNLFFVAVLLTPVPLPENVRELTRASVLATSSTYSRFVQKLTPSRPEGFLPHPALYITLILSNLMAVFLIPFASNTSSFMTVVLLARTLPFSFLSLPYITPLQWGKVHSKPHDAHGTYTTLFRTISALSMLLHLKSTIMALVLNTPDSTYYRHNILHPFKEEHLSTFDRSSTAIGRVFNSIGEHPAVGSVGWDVILSGLSFGVWAAARGLDPGVMLASSLAFVKRIPATFENEKESDSNVDTLKPIVSIPKGPGRPKKTDADDESSGPALTRRGRRRKITAATDDATYQPEAGQLAEGDENSEEEWDVAALAWGMISSGGLGLGSAAVLGGEMMAR